MSHISFAGDNRGKSQPPDPDEIEKRINAFAPDKQYPDDRFVLVTLREALAGYRENNGVGGACLVQEVTGKIVERGRSLVPRLHPRAPR